MPGRMEGRNCLIVGGTSGIGLASARRFLQEGGRVVVAGLDGPGAAPHAGEPGSVTRDVLDLLEPLGPCAGWSLDASSALQAGLLFERALEFFGGRLDVLFHVAGISGRRFGDGPLDGCTGEGWDKVMETNSRALFLTNQEAVQ